MSGPVGNLRIERGGGVTAVSSDRRQRPIQLVSASTLAWSLGLTTFFLFLLALSGQLTAIFYHPNAGNSEFKNGTFLIAPIQCSGNGSIAANCLPHSLDLENVTAQLLTSVDAIVDNLMVDSLYVQNNFAFPDNTTCPNGPLPTQCIPPLTFDDATFINSTFEGTTHLNGMGYFTGDWICATPFWPSCIPPIILNTETCTGPLHEECIPKNGLFETVDINSTLVNEGVTYLGGPVTIYSELFCDFGGFIDPGCVDISNKTCPSGHLGSDCMAPIDLTDQYCTGPLTNSCLPILDLTQEHCSGPLRPECLPPLNISGQTCSSPIGNDCLPPNATFENLIVTNLTVLNYTRVDIIIIKNETLEIDHLTANFTMLVKHVELEGPLECTGNGSIDPACLTCPMPLGVSCIPPVLEFEAIAVFGEFLLVGDMLCEDGGYINASCVDISHKTCPGGPLFNDCIPIINLADQFCSEPLPLDCVPEINLSDQYCSIPLTDECVNISALMCSSPIASECIQFSNASCPLAPMHLDCIPEIDLATEYCSTAIETQCIPTNLTFTTVNVTTNATFAGTVVLAGQLQCTGAGAVDPDCVNISNKTCSLPLDGSCVPPIDLAAEYCSAPIETQCFPANISFFAITVDYLRVINDTIYENIIISRTNLSYINALFANNTIFYKNTTLEGPLFCKDGGYVDPDCVNISSKTCTSPLDVSCVPPIDLTDYECTGPLGAECIPDHLNLTRLNVDMYSSFSGPVVVFDKIQCIGDGTLDGSCLNLSEQSCGLPVQPSCIPHELNFTIVNVTQHQYLEGPLTCSGGGYIDPGCVNISSHECSSPLSASCMDPYLTPTNLSVASVANFYGLTTLVGSELTCSAGGFVDPGCVDISAKSCSMPINADCLEISGLHCFAALDPSCIPVTNLSTAEITGILAVAHGGTGLMTLTGKQVILSNAAGTAMVEGGVMNNGYVMIGSTGGLPVPAAIVGNTGAVVTNGAGTITITVNLAAAGGIVPIANGGTNSGTALVGNRVMLSTSTAIVESTTMSDGFVIIGSTSGAPIPAAIVGNTGAVVTNAANSITITVNLAAAGGTLPVTHGGTGTVSLSGNRSMVSNTGGTAIVEAAAQTNGELLIGSTGAAPVVATLTGTTGAVVTNGAGTITITVNLATAGGVVPIASGGTNSATTLNGNRMMVSNPGATAIVEGAALTNGEVFIGSTGGAPIPATLTGNTGAVVTNGANSITITVNLAAAGGTLPVTHGGTGTVSLSGNRVMISNAGGTAIVEETAMTNGQLLIGSTGAAPALATLTGTTGAVVTNGAGTITITVNLATAGGIVPIASGGTNSGTTLVGNRVMLSTSTAIVESTTMSDGFVVIGSSSGAPVPAAIVGNTGAVVTNAANSITITVNLAAAGGTLPVTHGGTGTVSLSGNRSMVSNTGGTAIVEAAAQTNGQLLIGSTGAAPVVAALTGTTGAVVTNGAGTITITVNLATAGGIVPIASGGTNSGTTLNGHRIMVSSTGGASIVEAAAMSNGQLLIGSTGAAPVVATLTAGTGTTITNGAGSITIGLTPVFATFLRTSSTTVVTTIASTTTWVTLSTLTLTCASGTCSFWCTFESMFTQNTGTADRMKIEIASTSGTPIESSFQIYGNTFQAGLTATAQVSVTAPSLTIFAEFANNNAANAYTYETITNSYRTLTCLQIG